MPASELGFETASWGRRILALFVDWVASTLVVIAIAGWDDYQQKGSQAATFGVPLVLVLESAIFIALLGGSFGQVATRLRVVSTDRPGNVPILKALARQILVLLIVPPLVFRHDGRGLHDMAAGSATVTLQTWQALSRG